MFVQKQSFMNESMKIFNGFYFLLHLTNFSGFFICLFVWFLELEIDPRDLHILSKPLLYHETITGILFVYSKQKTFVVKWKPLISSGSPEPK